MLSLTDDSPPSATTALVLLLASVNASSSTASNISVSSSSSSSSSASQPAIERTTPQPRCVVVTSDKELDLQWMGFFDPDYPLAMSQGAGLTYTVSLGSTPNATNLLPPTHVGAVTSTSLDFDRSLPQFNGRSGQQVTACVWATNAAGLTSEPSCATTAVLLTPSTVMSC